MTFLLHGEKKHEISQAFAKAGTLWVRFEKEQDIERAVEGTLFNWKCMGLWLHLPHSHQDLPCLLCFHPPGWWRWGSLVSAEVPLWGRHTEEGSLTTADQKGSDEAGLLCLTLPSFPNNFLWTFRLQEFPTQETDVVQAERSLGMGCEVRIAWLQNLGVPLISCASWAS